MGATRLPRRIVAGLAAGVTCLTLAGCNGIPPEPFVAAQAADRTPTAPPALTSTALQSAFDQFLASHPGQISLAWVPVGGAGAVQKLGSTTDSDAWSTIKVPIAIAALAEADEGEATARRRQIRNAIEWSDNDDAARLYRSLGAGSDADDAVEAVLRAGGDSRTEVNQDAEGHANGFGRSVWRVEDSAVFAGHLPCDPQAAFVYDEMGRISEDHRWGLGALGDRARYKGGWGPSEHGYLLRQLGTVAHDGGGTAVAFVIHPADGDHDTAAATASALATWFAEKLGPADAGTCPAPTPTGGPTED